MDGSTMMSAIMWTASVILTGASYGSSGVLADRENLISFHQPIPTVAGGKYSGTYSSSTYCIKNRVPSKVVCGF